MSAFSAGVLSMRAGALLALRRFDEAAAMAAKGIEAVHPRPSTFAYLAASLGHLGRTEEARKTIDKLRELHPDYLDARASADRINTGSLPWEAVGEPLAEGLRLCGALE